MTLSTKAEPLPPLTPFSSADTMRSVQIEASAHHSPRGSPPVASVPCLALSDTAETSDCPIQTSRIQLPASLPSDRFCCPSLSPLAAARGTMKALTPASLTQTDRSPRLLRLAFPTFRPQPREPSAGRFASRLSASGCFQASPHMSRLATDPRRIRFVILRTVGSSPVAPHPASLATQLPSTTEPRHPPARTCTVPTWQLHGRTHAGATRRRGESGNGRSRTGDGEVMIQPACPRSCRRRR